MSATPSSALRVLDAEHRSDGLAGFLTINRAPAAVIDDALIVISEMIANAVSHGMPKSDGTVEISWTINGDLLELSVHDAGERARSSRSTSTRTR